LNYGRFACSCPPNDSYLLACAGLEADVAYDERKVVLVFGRYVFELNARVLRPFDVRVLFPVSSFYFSVQPYLIIVLGS
jgi:hypothetical protein